MTLSVELERETDGRWIAEVPELPGVLAYAETREAALAHAQALALRVLAERLEHGETPPEPFKSHSWRREHLAQCTRKASPRSTAVYRLDDQARERLPSHAVSSRLLDYVCIP